jgi:3-hydroxy-9,10-secoandrosta-1,3,5(10)-triene-9,17-dione monooxygenase reductase component
MSTEQNTATRQFRAALGTFTTGVTIVTTCDSTPHDIGLTANSFNSVSLDPPMVLWSLAKSSLSLAAFLQAQYFAVHVLSDRQQALSERFARRGVDKFSGLQLERGFGGIPLLEGCAARFECRTAFRHEGGDHEIFVGEVLRFNHFGRPPLVFHSGRYASVVSQPRNDATADEEAQEGTFTRDFLGYLLGATYHLLLAPIRQELDRRRLLVSEYYLLSILGVDGDRTRDETLRLMAFAGYDLTGELMLQVQQRGLVQMHDELLRLTDVGRRNMIELLAVAKGAEADAESELNYSETRQLKQLLRRLLRRAGSTLPPLWRKR